VSRGRTSLVTIGGLILITAACVAAGWLSPTPNQQFKDAAAVLSISTGIAVGIERFIEGFWTVAGQLSNTWWPLSVPPKGIETLVSDLDTMLKPLYDQTDAVVRQLAATGVKTQGELSRANSVLAKLKERVNSIQQGGDGANLQLDGALALQGIDYLSKLDDRLGGTAKSATDGMNAALNFLVSFKNNPARRLVSLFLGVLLGLAVTGTLGLDLVGAAAGITSSSKFHWGVMASGLAVGLGSSPTHEVIRSIQEYKNSRKAVAAG
jgi:hypothetical protein